MIIAVCAECGTKFSKSERSARIMCSDCLSAVPTPAAREPERNNGLLEQLSRAGAVFAEVAMNRLGHDQKLAALEILDAGGKVCVVVDLALSEDSVAAARLYLYQKGSRPTLLGQLAAIGSEVRPAVLN